MPENPPFRDNPSGRADHSRLRSRHWLSMGIAAVLILAVGLATGFLMSKRLTLPKFERIARAEIAERDPTFPKDAVATFRGKYYASRYDWQPQYWEISLTRRDTPTGYVIRQYDPERIQIGTAKFGPGNSESGDMREIEPPLVRSP